MQIYPFLISHCKNNRPLFTDRFPLYTNTDREIVTGKEREVRAGMRKGWHSCTFRNQKKQWQYLKSVRMEKGRRRKERGRMMAEWECLGITIMCLSVSL